MTTTKSLMLAAVAALSLGTGVAMAQANRTGATTYGYQANTPAYSYTTAPRYDNRATSAVRQGYGGAGSADHGNDLPGLMGGGG